MLKKTVLATVLAASFAIASPALADTLSFVSLPGSDTFSATTINIVNPGTTGVAVGSYWSGFNGGSMTITPTTWSSGGGTETVVLTNGALTDTLTLTSYVFTGNDHDLTITANGTSQITGGDIIPISFRLTTQLAPGVPAGTSTTFSGNINTVPLPGALPLFATGLAGLGLLRLRKKKARKA